MKLKASSLSQVAQDVSFIHDLQSHHAREETEMLLLSIPKKLTTSELAACLRVSPQTPIAALSRAGHYLGLRPRKLGNGRLLWDADAVSRLLNGEVL